ncbi:hypothetical protein KVH31_34420 [Streptomyces olivaceus]|uniref:DUF6221 family protein n=1 Tax=Streptomyces olivaceus TaxID=47716 RepID=UPI001CCB5A50|nr:DUF6221 family protein [Streptomyces olivaceus]MBZ6211592.1 hypothetical protein [Streptomyces olivaceus]
MTAQGEDILAWLDATIAGREAVAREACDGGEGRWHNGWRPEGELEDGETDNGCGVGDERDRTVVYDEGRPNKSQSVHIALNDPESVLRRCAADQTELARHTPTEWPTAAPAVCPSCARWNHDAAMGDDAASPVQFPCPSILSLAEGYGWTEGER